MITAIALLLLAAGFFLRMYCDLLAPYWLRVVIACCIFGGAGMLLGSVVILSLRYMP